MKWANDLSPSWPPPPYTIQIRFVGAPYKELLIVDSSKELLLKDPSKELLMKDPSKELLLKDPSN